MPILAQGDKDFPEIKKVVETFINRFRDRDINSTMEWVSADYSVVNKTGSVIDYPIFKSKVERRTNAFFENLSDYIITDIQFYNLNIQDIKATIEIKWNWKAFNLDTLREQSGAMRKQVSLTREYDRWKITQWKDLLQTK